jgi:hypothetical protein
LDTMGGHQPFAAIVTKVCSADGAVIDRRSAKVCFQISR